MLHYLSRQDLVLDSILCAALIIAWMFPRFCDNVIGGIERWGKRVAAHRNLAIFITAAASILLRLSLWPFGRLIPTPHVHDEFSYLLAADTFAHGRLTNPTHPMWHFFEAFHINQVPTYMSKYPPAQGAALALGQLLGHPWVGVLLSVAAMCGAIVWMLQGWMPARWAFLGGVLLIASFSAANYWIDSYWGGAVAAVGGALVVGAVPRLFRHQRIWDALLLGLGTGVLALSRPYEGVFLCLPVVVWLAAWLVGPRSPSWRITFPRVVAPAAAVVVLTLAFIGYYNWRGTGSPLLFPYMVNDQQYMRAPHFFWQQLLPEREYRNPQFDEMYNRSYVELWKFRRISGTWSGLEHGLLKKVADLQDFFVPRQFFLALILTLPWLCRDRKAIFLSVPVTVCTLAGLAVVWYEPHYLAPILAALYGIVLQAIRHLRCWRWSERRVGISLSRAIILFSIAMLPLRVVQGIRHGTDPTLQHMRYRETILRELEHQPGEHLVLVRYSDDHDVGWDWVYNRAEIDRAKVVWAREIPSANLRPLLDYFRGRVVWQVDADDDLPKLKVYSTSSN